MSVLNSSAPIFNVKNKNYEIWGLCKGDGLQKAWVWGSDATEGFTA
jgi:hypothetical protein